ncbi:tetraacyldisaccharide 4'-kinase [Roseiconus nitratireducens]|uniref:Tetraacyldisaccharide 4'-kinase n=1 Tax=Roseiconus nitratireducens TaxID=2605748 RepID=A0A5M6CXA5_9BACT|nr:tetraacyldisaccharide 4'-kinase [Roseiconus nitratireducens]KAA5539723.1 tetraacyldisaccharide 4'-kinase [Roseiconus nitratireducens]
MSGQKHGPVAAAIRCGLSLASVPYRIGVRTRNRRFDRDADAVQHCGVPVVSVGNLTTGGTGKTPVVAYLARWFRDREVRVAIVSRGYGRGDADHNDEAAELHQRLPDVPHLQDPDRVRSAQIAVEELESQLILMDDGFQHRRLHRDLDIVLIDMTCPFGYGHLLPRGLLREPVDGLRRAGAVILTRCDQVDAQAVRTVTATVREHLPSSAPIVASTHQPSQLLTHPDTTGPIDALRRRRVAAVCGIGNPSAFHQTLLDCGAQLVATRSLPDHAEYDRETVQDLDRWVRELDGIDEVICTQKDLVKLQTDRLGGKPLRALVIEADIENTPEFQRSLEAVLAMVLDSSGDV